MPRTLFALLCLLPALTYAAPASQSFEARVVAVADGDTLTVLDSNHLQHKIRVAGIDAPEKGQPFGDRSKQSLSRAVMGKDVRIEWTKQDRYGRYVAKVWATPVSHPCTSTGEPCHAGHPRARGACRPGRRRQRPGGRWTRGRRCRRWWVHALR
ncbi:MAG: thermonuclease family protein [Anaerolineae bacterium]